MPRMDQAPPEKQLVKLLLIGDGKIGKSYYAGLPAQQGFNVLYLDGDVALQTLSMLPPEAKSHLYHMNVGDTMKDGSVDHRFADFMKEFISSPRFIWNDTTQATFSRKDDWPNSEVWELFPARMDSSTVLVIDSWTSYVQSVMMWAAQDAGFDLAEIDTPKMRPLYQAAANKLTQTLVVIQRLPCHVIVIAHPDEFTKTEKPEGAKLGNIKETDLKVLWTKMIPKSSSRPHALTMSKFFTDIAWMETNATGSQRLLNFRMSDERICGGHFNERKTIDEYSFSNLVGNIGGVANPGYPPIDSWLKTHGKGEFVPAGEKPAESKILGEGSPNSDTAKPKGIAGLAAMKRSA